MNEQEIIDGLVRTELLSTVYGQLPEYIKNDIASLVSENQMPGSFGDLVKRSVEIVEEHRQFEGSNVVSMIGRRSAA
jgi:hypothetical protein